VDDTHDMGDATCLSQNCLRMTGVAGRGTLLLLWLQVSLDGWQPWLPTYSGLQRRQFAE